MSESGFSIDEIKQRFQNLLPEGITVESFRNDKNNALLSLSPIDWLTNEKIVYSNPQKAFENTCIDSSLKLLLKDIIHHKFDIEFYDLICLCILFLNESDETLAKFLCTEILQTTFDNWCQNFCVNRLQRIVKEKTIIEDIEKNHGIHPNLKTRINAYEKLSSFIEKSESKYAEYQVDKIEFYDDKIIIVITSEAEYIYGDDMQFTTIYPIGTLTIELNEIVNITSDTWGWNGLKNGKLEIRPCISSNGEEVIQFSFIHIHTNSPYFRFKCNAVSILDYKPSGIEIE